jgi:DNA gyrase inhibitor GyrI
LGESLFGVESVGFDPNSLPSFGLYYDNPNEVPANELRAIFGKIVDSPIPGLRCNSTGAFDSV